MAGSADIVRITKDFMERFDFSARRLRVTVWAVAVLSLAGCDTLNDVLAPDRVDYQNTTSAPRLEVPADLKAAPLDQRYVAPSTTASLGGQPTRATTPAGNTTEGLPTAQDPYGMHVEQDGTRRWLVVNGRTPDELWPQLKAFWEQNGFVLKTDSPATGIIETDWAENRAQIPGDWFRNSVGKLLDFVYSSGTRDRFRMLVERNANSNATVITISHTAREEVLTGRDKTSSRWVERPRDPKLEAAIYAQLMQKFGLTDKQAQQLIDGARHTGPKVEVAVGSAGASMLDLAESFDRAWLRVGLALDRTDFAVDNRDRERGIYYVRFNDPVQEIKREGLLGKLIYGGKPNVIAKEYLVNVRPKGDGATQVAVIDSSGQLDTSSDAQRLVAALHQQLN
ncbi:Beta-barrel assembly machine subunit BamC [Mycetohabitans endofungorum]|uniref:Beta-barrel assembly machine subunit BamC n=2 Tax=Burkholderiaceae TaxID=119060 RepID=A0A2P5KB90_9BURK|nr:Beta-barrel assembly machine subunit BamC [Mycetohabitans endofungorum]